jgi:hypothetical protein
MSSADRQEVEGDAVRGCLESNHLIQRVRPRCSQPREYAADGFGFVENANTSFRVDWRQFGMLINKLRKSGLSSFIA